MRGIIFDKDGTLFDFHATWGDWAASCLSHLSDGDDGVLHAMADAIDYDLETQMFQPTSLAIAGTLDDIVAALHPKLKGWTPDRVAEAIGAKAADVTPHPATPLNPLLTELKRRNIAVGLATNDNYLSAEAHLTAAGVLEQFDYVAGYDSGYGAKPDPGMLLGFSDILKLPVEEVLMVGDSLHDLHAGRAAGMRTMGVLTGVAPAEELSPLADVILPHIGHLPAWLDGKDAGLSATA